MLCTVKALTAADSEDRRDGHLQHLKHDASSHQYELSQYVNDVLFFYYYYFVSFV